ncbi:MAG: nuclear transport factor 2 family protein [Leadbetterella sp.]|nr:nuclear transport factor 2 family protein [Leadbetterella sp.]
MKKLITLVLFFTCFTGYSQTREADSVRETINRFFDAMRNSDSAAMKSVVASGAILQTITATNDIKPGDFAAFYSSVAKAAKGSLDERITFGTVNTDGNLAAAWTPYEFYYNGKFSHCGVNSFQLHKENGAWKIRYVIDTRRKEDCVKN